MRKCRKEIQTRAEEVTVMEFVKCDFCGEEVPKPDANTGGIWSNEVDWSTGGYGICETEISFSEGESYPEGGNKTTLSFDICPKCFKEKLIPWAKSQGAELTEEEFDW